MGSLKSRVWENIEYITIAILKGSFTATHDINRVTQKTGNLKNPTKIEEIQEKKILTEIEPLQLAF